ncbi:two-component response regulator [Gracilibacillus boraciitolerans JCM 21714]|uniref:Two-component response regulator n=1 Tax=Gracilibacillus boraciitolerans JCM 21714 TaxID=1298598 RepID=W4VHW9_9BACI|nr:two-component response regulator [Gracilibacillus boraciitolerans JCM 21714]
MRFGVKHYLLKPCNESNIVEALKDVVKEKQNEEEAESYMKLMEEEVTKNTVSEKEEILKQFFLYQQVTDDLKEKMKSLIEEVYPSERFYFCTIYIDSLLTYDHITDVIESIQIQLNESKAIITFIENKIIMMMSTSIPEEEVNLLITCLLQPHEHEYSIVSTPPFAKENIDKIPKLDEMIQQLFYQPTYTVINHQSWLSFHEHLSADLEIDLEKIMFYLKKQQQQQAMQYLQNFINKLKRHRISPKVTRVYFIQIYLLLMTRHSQYTTENRVQAIGGELEDLQHLTEYVEFFENLFNRMIEQVEHPKKYSQVVKQMLQSIDEQIENSELSLQWLATNCLYMNADYLGKTFKKEIGQRFSSYVTNARINKAVEIIEEEQDIKVFELAERLGFGNNPQYFSQLFKRMKGFTPSEIIRSNERD